MSVAELTGMGIPEGVATAALRIASRAEKRWGELARQGDTRAQRACWRATRRAGELIAAAFVAARETGS